MRRTFLLTFLISLLGIAFLHVIGTMFYFYIRIPFYDRIVHGLSGWLVGYVVLQFIFIQSGGKEHAKMSQTMILLTSIGAALIVGIGWELFEFTIGYTHLLEKGFIPDTILDIISDMIGGLVAGIIALQSKSNKNIITE